MRSISISITIQEAEDAEKEKRDRKWWEGGGISHTIYYIPHIGEKVAFSPVFWKEKEKGSGSAAETKRGKGRKGKKKETRSFLLRGLFP